jgi:hypothetical protein
VKIILHIGSDKTGTTALQAAFDQQRSELANQGIIYPKFNRIQNHAPLALELKSGVQGSAWEELNQIIQQAPETILLSSEMFCSLKKSHILKLKTWLEPHSITIICYIRSADEYLESGLMQRLKDCKTDRKFATLYRIATIIPSIINPFVYQAALKPYFALRWEKYFIPQDFIVRPYNKKCWHQENILLDFLHSIEAEELEMTCGAALSNRNVTPDISVIYALRFFSTTQLPWFKHNFSEIMTEKFNKKKELPVTNYHKRKLAHMLSQPIIKRLQKYSGFLMPTQRIEKQHHSPRMKYIRSEAPKNLAHYIIYKERENTKKVI